jgi:hypothetical protein
MKSTLYILLFGVLISGCAASILSDMKAKDTQEFADKIAQYSDQLSRGSLDTAEFYLATQGARRVLRSEMDDISLRKRLGQ